MKFQFRLNAAAEELVNAIRKTLNISPKDAVLDGLALLYVAMTQVQQGREIGSYDPEKREFTRWTTSTLEGLRARTLGLAGAAGKAGAPAPATPATLSG
jgi:hypothetical protein